MYYVPNYVNGENEMSERAAAAVITIVIIAHDFKCRNNEILTGANDIRNRRKGHSLFLIPR